MYITHWTIYITTVDALDVDNDNDENDSISQIFNIKKNIFQNKINKINQSRLNIVLQKVMISWSVFLSLIIDDSQFNDHDVIDFQYFLCKLSEFMSFLFDKIEIIKSYIDAKSKKVYLVLKMSVLNAQINNDSRQSIRNNRQTLFEIVTEANDFIVKRNTFIDIA